MASLRPLRADVALAMVLGVGVLLQDLRSPVWMLVLSVATAVALVWRRRYALWIAVVIGALSAAMVFVPGKPLPEDEVPLAGVAILLIAAYSIGAYERRLLAAILGGVVLTIG